MSDDLDDALDERIETMQRRAENFRELLREGEEITISLLDGEMAVDESFRSQLERKHPKLYGRLMSVEAQLRPGWLPYFLGLVAVIAVIVTLQLPWSKSLLGDDLHGVMNGWWFYLVLPPATLYLVKVGCGLWQKREFRTHRVELLELVARAGLDRDLLLVMLQDNADLESVTLELKLDHGPFLQP